MPWPRSARAIRQRMSGWQSIGSSDASCPQYSKTRLGLAAVSASRSAGFVGAEAGIERQILGAHQNVHAVDLKTAEPIDALAQFRRADRLAAPHRVEALRRQRDATGLGNGEFGFQGCAPGLP